MFRLISIKTIIITIATAAGLLSLLLIYQFQVPFMRACSYSGTVIFGLCYLISHPPVFLFLQDKFWLNKLFPILTGNWNVRIHTSHESGSISLKAKIEATLFKISIRFEQEDGTVVSDTDLVGIVKEDSGYKLSYIYEQNNKNIEARTIDTFQGAGIVRFRGAKPEKIEGQYFTNRGVRDKKMTAGLVEYTKIHSCK